MASADQGLKVCVIGGGSTYTPELVDGLLRRAASLPVADLWLLDPNQERLAIVTAFAKRMTQAAGVAMRIHATADATTAIRASDFIVTQLRVGGQAARHRDELLGRAFGLVGQETTGVGGFAKALRTIPVMLGLARVIEREAPAAIVINFTNPAGLITECLKRHTQVNVIGLCNVPWNMRIELAAVIGASPDTVALDYVGLNHLSWVRRLLVDGEDRTSQVVRQLSRANGAVDPSQVELSPSTISMLGVVPSYYGTYFYETGRVLRWQETHPTRASQVMDIEQRLLDRYRDQTLTRKPPELMERGGAYYSESAAALMVDIHADTGATHIVNVRNDGAIEALPADVVIEAPARVGADGARPVTQAPLRPDLDALVRSVKDYELLTIEAATSGDQTLALHALLTNPLGPDASNAASVWQRIRAENAGALGALDG